MNFGTLQSFMERSSTPYLTLSEMQNSAGHIISALAAIHAAGYLHNDIQPSNVLLNHDYANRFAASLNGLSRCTRQEIPTEESSEAGASPPSLINEFSHLYLAPEMILS